MINFLMILHFGEKFLAQVAINPADVEVEIVHTIVECVPFKFFGDMPDDRILGFFIEQILQLRLMSILYFLGLEWGFLEGGLSKES